MLKAQAAASQSPETKDWADWTEADSQAAGRYPGKTHGNPNAFFDTNAVLYIGLLVWLIGFGVVGIWNLNKRFAPLLHDRQAVEEVADAFAAGKNYATFDLNINIRELRDAHIARLPRTPDVAVLGASHWQEAAVDLIGHKNFYNAHVHRDYYEDMLAMVEIFERHGKLPRHLIISIRDNLFTPVAERTDFLWLPGIPYYRAMASRLGIEQHSRFETLPVDTWRQLLSFSLLRTNAWRWFTAPVAPHATEFREFKTLDTLLPGGSILWSADHRAIFTGERARAEALAFAAARRNDPPRIDPRGVASLERLLEYLQKHGVRVFLAHPPFNPVFYDAVAGSPFMAGLRQIEDLTVRLADRFALQIIGSFDPRRVGCEARMYIDAEHSSAECLGKVLDQYNRLDRAPAGRPATPARR